MQTRNTETRAHEAQGWVLALARSTFDGWLITDKPGMTTIVHRVDGRLNGVAQIDWQPNSYPNVNDMLAKRYTNGVCRDVPELCRVRVLESGQGTLRALVDAAETLVRGNRDSPDLFILNTEVGGAAQEAFARVGFTVVDGLVGFPSVKAVDPNTGERREQVNVCMIRDASDECSNELTFDRVGAQASNFLRSQMASFAW